MLIKFTTYYIEAVVIIVINWLEGLFNQSLY
jgi:hypothetical protein